MEGASSTTTTTTLISNILGPYRRPPLKSNTLNTLSHFYSLLPFPSLSPDDGSESRSKQEASGGMGGSVTAELHDCDEVNNGGNREVLNEEARFNGSEMLTNEPSLTNQAETLLVRASDRKDASDGNAMVCTVEQDLLGISRMLMDDTDDVGQSEQPNEYVNLDLFSDLDSFLGSGVLGQNPMPVGIDQSGEFLSGGNGKGDEDKKEVEVENSIFEGDVASQVQASMENEVSKSSDVVGMLGHTHTNNVQRNKRKLCNEKIYHGLSQMEGLTFSSHRSEHEEGSVSCGKVVDTVKKKQKSISADKDKTKRSKKAKVKHVKSGKGGSDDVEMSNRTKIEGCNPVVVHRKVAKKKLVGRKENSSTRKADKCCLESWRNIQYSREKLLQLQQIAVVPDNILKAVQVIGADILNKNQSSASGDPKDISCSERQTGTLSEGIKAEEKDAGTLKNKKRGSSSEARKEKKKRKRRQKRAELNKKHGVKRLKLRPPVPKQKVVPHCRHYLMGRCHEGEKCKFSHDGVPVTKSKPCRHFARQACMKGDDCPYDHQLINYPCHNYVDTGFCSKGDACLFSHKVQDTERTVDTSKEVKCPDQLGKLNSKQRHDANVLSSSGTPTPKNTKEPLGTKIIQRAQAPKGLSFLSFGKSSIDVFTKHEESGSSLQIYDPAEIGHPLNQVRSRQCVGSSKTLNSVAASTASRGNGSISFDKTSVVSSVHKMGSAGPTTPEGLSFPSLDGPSNANSGVTVQAILSNDRQNDSDTPIIGKKNSFEPDNLKANSVHVPAKRTSNTAQKALLSTLAFAAKCESGIKKSSAATSKEIVNKNEETSSSGGGTKNEATKASAILEFLFCGENKQKQ